MNSIRLNSNSEVQSLYQAYLRKAFPSMNLEFNANEINLALFVDGKICGGITLEKFSSLKEDSNIADYWDILNTRDVVKMKRLWVNHKDSKRALLSIFNSVLEHTDRDAFLYGVLSFPLSFARKSVDFIHPKKGWLLPKNSLEKCNWDPQLKNSSDGQKLLKTYLMFGAEPLGEMSGSEKDYSVRIVMGMNLKDFNYQTLASRYA